MPTIDPITTDPQRADRIVQELLTRYITVMMHDAAGGDVTEGLRLEKLYQSQRTLVIALVTSGLRTGEVLF